MHVRRGEEGGMAAAAAVLVGMGEGSTSSAAAAAAGRVVRVKREVLSSCMTCPLCEKLLKDATTISKCLHTFCRKCIYDKLNDEDEPDCCPICKIDLGCAPLEKLRPDHSLQDIRAKIFPFRRREVKAPEVNPSIALPVRRKERSLSSLVVNTPRVSTQTSLTGRRTKSVARKAGPLRGAASVIEESNKNEEDNAEAHLESSSSPETLSKIAQNKRQNLYNGEPSNYTSNKDLENGEKSYHDKAELWKPLNCLVEAANRKAPRFSSQTPVVKGEQANGPDTEAYTPKTKAKENANNPKIQDDKNGILPEASGMVKSKRFGISRKRAARELTLSTQAMLDAGAKRERRVIPVWFTLVASADQEGAPLPQIPSCFLRVKDGNLPISVVQKYIAKKLNIANEAEVEIMFKNQPLLPTLTIHSLIDTWLRSTPSQVSVTIGASAKDVVMVLVYTRKALTTT
ncbi:E3 ubiquitin protein ligase DRIP2 [Acorus calamus]|uniref:E3 ubiquitin protein ligase DRIP2 n=1 Tax=Acorus calamus TaxID=4465 RepID=A0AAV9ELX2_ACOCL|nr:E3 ubiquitin protein ligase DRIP2 [Acorus calamus]